MRKVLFNYRGILLSFTYVFLFIACVKNQDDKKVNSLKNVIENNLGKKISIPTDLKLYSPFSEYSMDSVKIAHSELKIYTQINTSCPSCIDGISKWINFATKLEKYKVPVILVCISKDNFELLRFLCENESIKKFPFPFFLDKKNQYVSKNFFMNESNQLETVLTDSKNNILLIGNPIHSKVVEDLYLAEIDKFLRKK